MAEAEGGALPLPTFLAAPRVLIVTAPFYRGVADMLIAGARAELARVDAAIATAEVPGALELAATIRFAEARFDGFVALGCVIRGATTHYETVCEESARGLTLLGLERGLCIGNGVLTCETMAQAEERADPAQMNKGASAAAACLHLIALKQRFSARPEHGADTPIQIA